MPAWTPPTELLPVTPEAYAQLRLYIDAGSIVLEGYAKARDGGCQPTDKGGSGCWPDIPIANSLPKIAEFLYRYVPATAVSLEPAQKFATSYFPGDAERFPDSDADRLGWPTFVDREQLIAALDGVTSPEVQKQLGSLDRPPDAAGEFGQLPSANVDDAGAGLSWWVMALSGGGFLSWLGKSKVLAILGPGKKLKVILAVGAGLLYALGAAGLVSNVLPEIKKLYTKTIAEPVARTANIIAIAAGIGGAVLIGAIVYTAVTNRKRQRALAA